MKIPKWICKLCKQTFTRHWNALRHCDKKHSSNHTSIILFTEYKKLDFFPLDNKSLHEYLQYPFVLEDRNSQNIKSINDGNGYNSEQQLDSNINPLDNFINSEQKIYNNNMTNFSQKYTELKNILDFVNEPEKNQFLKLVLFNAFNSNDPINHINEVIKLLRKTIKNNVTLNDMSKILNMEKKDTKELLKMALNKI
ncbi:MAG: hypothetical protein ACPKQO_01945 [Nitrososphaeraceae archaeon]